MTAFTYTPGGLVAVSGGHLAVLLDLPPDHELVGDVHATLVGGAPTVDDLLDVLVSLGLRTVTTFAIAEAAASGIRVVVRGNAQAVGVGAEPPTAVEGLWQNRFLDGATEVTLTVEGADGPVWPLAGGVVLASSITVSRQGSDAAAAAPAVVAPAAEPEPEPEPEAEPEPEPDAEPEPEPEPEPDETPAPDFDHLFGTTQVPVAPAEEPAPVDEAAPTEAEAEPAAAEDEAPETPPAETGEAQAEAPAAQPDGQTMASPLTGPTPVVQPPGQPRPGGGFIEAFPWEIGAPPIAAAARADASGPITQFPAAEPDGEAEQAPPAPAASFAPDMTIDRDQLIDHGGATGPVVVAARCPDGHLSPAYAGNCRVCGKALPAQQPFEVARPSLGVLRLSNGDTVMLDRGAVLGRNPRLPQGWTGEQPNLVKIHDPDRDVSSQHLEVRLDFWHVLVKDLGSTNGTEVILPGAEPVTLRANDALAIEPGTRVVLAGVFDFTFEVSP